MFCLNLAVSCSVQIMFMSSANRVGEDMWFIVPGKSLMYKRKKSGPSTDPCGTPLFTLFQSE